MAPLRAPGFRRPDPGIPAGLLRTPLRYPGAGGRVAVSGFLLRRHLQLLPGHAGTAAAGGGAVLRPRGPAAGAAPEHRLPGPGVLRRKGRGAGGQAARNWSDLMDEAGVDFTPVVYPGTGHAFFNDTNAWTYDGDAAEDAWTRTLWIPGEEPRVLGRNALPGPSRDSAGARIVMMPCTGRIDPVGRQEHEQQERDSRLSWGWTARRNPRQPSTGACRRPGSGTARCSPWRVALSLCRGRRRPGLGLRGFRAGRAGGPGLKSSQRVADPGVRSPGSWCEGKRRRCTGGGVTGCGPAHRRIARTRGIRRPAAGVGVLPPGPPCALPRADHPERVRGRLTAVVSSLKL